MTRSIPHDRFEQLIKAATATFIERGYRQTQMADVARAIGVAKGTLYGYVDSKEALFDAAVRFSDRPEDQPAVADLPLHTPPIDATVHYVQARLAAESADMVLVAIVAGAQTFDDPADELPAALDDLYLRLERNRRAIKLVDRCAAEYPELAQVWFGGGRWAQHQLLAELIRRRIGDGSYRPVDDVDVAARFILETIVFWALHRHFDPAPQALDDDTARRTIVSLLARTLLPEAS